MSLCLLGGWFLACLCSHTPSPVYLLLLQHLVGNCPCHVSPRLFLCFSCGHIIVSHFLPVSACLLRACLLLFLIVGSGPLAPNCAHHIALPPKESLSWVYMVLNIERDRYRWHSCLSKVKVTSTHVIWEERSILIWDCSSSWMVSRGSCRYESIIIISMGPLTPGGSLPPLPPSDNEHSGT